MAFVNFDKPISVPENPSLGFSNLDLVKGPAELELLTPDQLRQLEAEDKKIIATLRFMKQVLDNPALEPSMTKAGIEGQIFSLHEVVAAEARQEALKGYADREFLSRSFIVPSGKIAVVSERVADALEYQTDKKLIKRADFDKLVKALQSEAVDPAAIGNLGGQFAKLGVVKVQLGVLAPLKPLLNETFNRLMRSVPKPEPVAPPEPVPAPEPVKPPVPAPVPAPAPKPVTPAPAPVPPAKQSAPKMNLDELPYSFYEFIKQTDPAFGRMETAVMADPKFIEFFTSLKKQYLYYQKLPTGKMVEEIVVRPHLWIKLSPTTKALIQAMVEKNQPAFEVKVKEIATASHVERLTGIRPDLP